MPERIKKEELVRRLAARMGADETTATAWVDGIVETLYESLKAGESVTLPGFSGFYVSRADKLGFQIQCGPTIACPLWLVIDVDRRTLKR